MAALMAPVLAILIPAAAETSLPGTPEAFGEALKTWAATHRIKRAFVVVRRDGRIVYRPRSAEQIRTRRYISPSLSKAITAACIATLVRDGKLALRDARLLCAEAIHRHARDAARSAPCRRDGGASSSPTAPDSPWATTTIRRAAATSIAT